MVGYRRVCVVFMEEDRLKLVMVFRMVWDVVWMVRGFFGFSSFFRF